MVISLTSLSRGRVRSGDWQITYTVNSAAGIQVGDFAKLFDVGPLPILMGDNAAATILRNYPLKSELYNPARVNASSATVAKAARRFRSLELVLTS